jgi:hypothetical protein
MSLLPQQIIPQTVPFAKANAGGDLIIDKDWWLFLYNLSEQVLGNGGVSLSAVVAFEELDSDAADADAVVLRRSIQNLNLQVLESPQVSSNDLPDIARSLLLAQDAPLPDPPALAQPVALITPGASPYTYKAPFAGSVAVTGGTVSAIAILRQGTTVATGLTTGVFPVSRGDSLVITYSSLPTVTFIPGSPQ